jgi:pimeloyl-ACP methyl ester carboxylesterase
VTPVKEPALSPGSFTVPINGFRMYCEVAGTGPLLVWLPGAFAGVDRLRPLIDGFRRYFTVLTADANGTGRSTLGPGPITYVSMTADLVTLLDHLAVESAHFFGISDGGVCGLHMLIDFAHRVRSVSMSGTPYSHAAYSDTGRKVVSEMEALATTGTAVIAFRDAYALWSPNPEQFGEVVRRSARTWRTQPNFNQAMIGTIDRPTLVVTTDADEYIPEAELQRVGDWIPGARMVKIPGMPHAPLANPDPLAVAVRDFIGALAEAGQSLGH